MFRNVFAAAVIGLALGAGGASAQDDVLSVAATQSPALAALIEAAGGAEAVGLDAIASGEGPFTVFAPSEAAIAALGDASGADVAAILACHVVDGALTEADIRARLEDEWPVVAISAVDPTCELEIVATDEQVLVYDPTGESVLVESADVAASNGVVHVINQVMMRSSE